MEISLVRLGPGELGDLEEEWRGFEAPSFFTSWTWIGCAATARFPAPVLLRARVAGEVAALALFNRLGRWPARETLWLAESGIPALDSIYMEHNAVLARDGAQAACLAACLGQPIRPGEKPSGRRLMLSGVPAVMAVDFVSVGGDVRVRKTSIAPRIDFAALNGDYLTSLASNTRYQIRRSNRQYTSRGPLRIERAGDAAAAHAYLDALAGLHQRYWTGRGQAGAFANPAFGSFHHELIDRGFPRGEIDLLRVSAGDFVVGYLYNFRHRGRVSAYQSGFDYKAAHPHEKPGLACHHLAIEAARAEGCSVYDFLAGDDRYKTSLANASETLAWLDVSPAGTALSRALALRDRAKAVARALRDLARKRRPENFASEDPAV